MGFSLHFVRDKRDTQDFIDPGSTGNNNINNNISGDPKERSSSAGGGASAPLQVAVRIPAAACDVDTAIEFILIEHGISPSFIEDYVVAPLVEGGQRGQAMNRFAGAEVFGPSLSPETKELGILFIVLVFLKEPHYESLTNTGAVALIIHVPLLTGLAHRVFNFPWDRYFRESRSKTISYRDMSRGERAVKFMEGWATVPWLPQQTLTKVTNAGMLEEGESVRQFTHPWLLQDLVGFHDSVEKAYEEAEERWRQRKK